MLDGTPVIPDPLELTLEHAQAACDGVELEDAWVVRVVFAALLQARRVVHVDHLARHVGQVPRVEGACMGVTVDEGGHVVAPEHARKGGGLARRPSKVG